MSVAPLAIAPDTTPDPIEHVIVLMFENRSFDHLLGSLKEVIPGLDGIDKANPKKNVMPDEQGKPYFQEPTSARRLSPGPSHELKNVLAQIDGVPPLGPMGGFVYDYAYSEIISSREQRQEVMNYYDVDTLPALHALARNFTVCDRWFSSVPGPTWPNRFFVHSGTCLGITDPVVSSSWHSTYTQSTVYDRLNDADVSWRIYFSDFPQSLVLVNQRHPENIKNYSHIDNFFLDVQHAPTFPAYTFIEPNYLGLMGQNDWHPPSDILAGDAFLGRLYNAIRSNMELWQTTLFVVVFDEHGGFYDHVQPPQAPSPGGHQGYDCKLYGVRVPALLISPFTGKTVEHQLFDHTSILRYLQDKYHLGYLGDRTAAAKSIGNCITNEKRTDTPEHVMVGIDSKTITDFVGDPAPRPIDATQQASITFTAYLESKTITPADVLAMRNAMMIGGPEGQSLVAIDRVRQYLKAQQS
jgi:phospholipase C